jgi:NADPH-dependent 2,4-dienoyl-CoA reductase/sulfur reductase-like enzyme
MDYQYDVIVIGGGPAGLAAAVSAQKQGGRVAVIERDFRLGGILEQCIHTGFGLKYFNEELSGPQYALRFIDKIRKLNIDVYTNTMVLSIEKDPFNIYAVSREKGICNFKTESIVLGMGCRERTRAVLALPGTRPAGIYTAGTAQRFVNIQNYLVGREIVILGSGDIGMIMARRMTLEGARVKAVVEIMPYLAGLMRNKVQCLDDFGIPLYLSHTVTNIFGNRRITGVRVSKVDDKMQPLSGADFCIECDTLLLSVGLIPENELSKNCGVVLDPVTGGPVVDHRMQTNIPGIFACGNVVHVNDLVDNVSLESEIAGKYAALSAGGILRHESSAIAVNPGENIRYIVPQKIVSEYADEDIPLYFRVKSPDKNVHIRAFLDGREIYQTKRKLVNPGEIEHIVLKSAVLKNGGAQLSVSCKAETPLP